MKLTKPIFLFLILAVSLFGLAYSFLYSSKAKANGSIASLSILPVKKKLPESDKLQQMSTGLVSYCKKKGLNNQLCFLIDMSMESGSKRFFVYNLKTDTVTDAGLVTHGRCNEKRLSGRRYSNDIGGGCTSLGRYKVGGNYYGKFGLAFKLYGLDQTNSNAFKRFVVLHGHNCVPQQDVTPQPICQSNGCPTVSPEYLLRLNKLIKASTKPILLYIFE